MEPKLRNLFGPDGRSILGGPSLYKLDTRTGDVAPPLLNLPRGEGQPPLGLLSPDGKAVYYRTRDRKKGSSIRVRQLETGVDKELYAAPTATPNSPPFLSLVLSPDGRHLAVVSAGPGSATSLWGSTSLSVLPTASAKPRELLALKETETISGALAWTPDGRYILFFKGRKADNSQVSNSELWRIRAEGGQPEKLLEVPMQAGGLCVHPDGRRIAFDGVAGQQKSEVWVMENFLPPLPKEATSGSSR
jgi:Tol biopolymer transport system component